MRRQPSSASLPTPIARGLAAFLGTVSRRRAAERRIDHLSHHDTLTGLPNRLLFESRLEQALAAGRRSGAQVALVALDLDGFRAVNDVLGHAEGDALLRRVAGILNSCCDAADTVARLGDDEFAIVQTGQPQPEGARLLSERILLAIGLMGGAPRSMGVGVSLGVATYPDNGVDVGQLRRNADMALHRAKGSGKGRVQFFDPVTDTEVRRRRRLALDLDQAIARQQLHLVYQPVVSARTGDILGFEALMRWQHPEFGLVPPDQFIPLAEESGSIAELGYWALQKACAEAADWTRPLNIAVNLSATQFRLSDLAGQVRRTLARTGLDPSRLELEITESALLRDREQVSRVLLEIGALGVGIVLDDFGTGYSSLGNIQSFPFDKVKIDRSFVAALGADDAALPIVRAIVGLCRSLDLRVVAEGVETTEQLDLLLREGCAELQGFLIGRPQTSETIACDVSRSAALGRVA